MLQEKVNVIIIIIVQSNFLGSNIFRTVEICSKHGLFGSLSVDIAAGQEADGDNLGKLFLIFYTKIVC